MKTRLQLDLKPKRNEKFTVSCASATFEITGPYFFEEGTLRQWPALARCIYTLQAVFTKENLNFQKSTY
jgi:hypothetical protein